MLKFLKSMLKVLILVFVEDGMIDDTMSFFLDDIKVLILVFVEDGMIVY